MPNSKKFPWCKCRCRCRVLSLSHTGELTCVCLPRTIKLYRSDYADNHIDADCTYMSFFYFILLLSTWWLAPSGALYETMSHFSQVVSHSAQCHSFTTVATSRYIISDAIQDNSSNYYHMTERTHVPSCLCYDWPESTLLWRQEVGQIFMFSLGMESI